MPSARYMEIYHSYWPNASQKIYELLTSIISKEERILEVGAGSGHLLFNLLENGYEVKGCELRSEQCKKTQLLLERGGFKDIVFCADVMDQTEQYDVIYSTGLLQCLQGEQRKRLIEKMASLAKKMVIVVPEITVDRNEDAIELIGVAGCSEYTTVGLRDELSVFFDYIDEGKWSSEELEIEDNFCYYVCKHLE